MFRGGPARNSAMAGFVKFLHKQLEPVMPQLRVAKGTTGGAGAPRTLNERATERAFHPCN